MAEGTPGPGASSGPGWGRYIVGDYINLDLTIHHAMHIDEVTVVFVHEDDDAVELVIRGKPKLEESGESRMSSVVRVSREITVEDVPGTYAVSRFEVLAASTRTLTKEYSPRRTIFEIGPEPNEWGVDTMLLVDPTHEPLYPTDDEVDED